MKRRKFLVGAGGASLGGSTLIGSGAFSAVESQRQLTVQVAEDSNAYLGLEPCSTLNGENFVGRDGRGHITIDISEHSDAANAGSDVNEPAEGINSDSLTAFDNVLQVCNQGKEDACVWIEAEVAEKLLEEHDTSLPAIDYYVLDGDGEPRSIRGEENAVKLPVGECFCVGVRVVSENLSAGDQVVEDEEIRIFADVEGTHDCPVVNGGDVPPGEEPQDGQAISWIAFCGDGLTADDYDLTIQSSDGDGPTSVSYSGPTPDNIVVFGAARLFNTSGPTITLSGDEVQWESGMNATEQRPASPCQDGNCGPKFDYMSASDMFQAVDHQDQCVDESDG
jgi:hypothetical protein